MRKVFILTTFLFSTTIFAFDCPNMRLDQDFPGGKPVNKAKYKTMQTVPVQKQDLGICYAYGAAQMVDAVRHKRKLEKGEEPDWKVSSPVFLAVNTTKAWDERGLYYRKPNNQDPHFPFEGGHLCDAFKTAQDLGTCSKDKLDAFFESNKLNEETFFEKLLEVENTLKLNQERINKEHIDKLNEIYYKPKSEDDSYLDNYLDKLIQVNDSISSRDKQLQACTYTAIDEMYDSFKEVFGDAFKINRILFKTYFSVDMFDNNFNLSYIFRSICPEPDRTKVITNSKCHTFDVAKSIDSGKSYPFTQKILTELKNDSLPVGISYCSKLLKRDPSFKGITTKTKSTLSFKKDKNGDKECGNHASVVTGSRWNPKSSSCELLIRNSWGAQCSSYKKYYPDKSTLEANNPGKSISQYDVKCEAGNIWVDYKTLENNTYRVQHL